MATVFLNANKAHCLTVEPMIVDTFVCIHMVMVSNAIHYISVLPEEIGIHCVVYLFMHPRLLVTDLFTAVETMLTTFLCLIFVFRMQNLTIYFFSCDVLTFTVEAILNGLHAPHALQTVYTHTHTHTHTHVTETQLRRGASYLPVFFPSLRCFEQHLSVLPFYPLTHGFPMILLGTPSNAKPSSPLGATSVPLCMVAGLKL